MTALEQLPDTWDSDRDERFFRITARALPATVVEAASALLASYDDAPDAAISAGSPGTRDRHTPSATARSRASTT